MPSWLRLKSMIRYLRLWPPPTRRIEMWPWLSRPPRLLERLEQRLLRRRARDLGEIRDRAEARALGDRLELTNAHVGLALEDLDRVALARASRSPSSSAGGARRSCPRGASCRAGSTSRRRSPSRRTASRSAWRIAGLLASGATSNMYSPRSWYAAELCSVTIGRTMVRCSVGIAYFPFFFVRLLRGRFFAARLLGGSASSRPTSRPSRPAFFGRPWPSAFAAAFFAAASRRFAGASPPSRARARRGFRLGHRRQRLADRAAPRSAPRPTTGCGTSRRRCTACTCTFGRLRPLR